MRSGSRSLLCLIKELKLSHFGCGALIVEWCGGWKVTQQDEDCQRANELIMSQRFACSWCCKASCFISSHLAYVPRKGLKLSGRESEARDTAQLFHTLIQFTCKSLRYHTHSSKGRVTRPQVQIHCDWKLWSQHTRFVRYWTEGVVEFGISPECLSIPL